MRYLFSSGLLIYPASMCVVRGYFKVYSLPASSFFVLGSSLAVYYYCVWGIVGGIAAMCFTGMIRYRDTSTNHAAESESLCCRDDHAEPIFKEARIVKMDMNRSKATSNNLLCGRRTQGDTPQILE